MMQLIRCLLISLSTALAAWAVVQIGLSLFWGEAIFQPAAFFGGLGIAIWLGLICGTLAFAVGQE